MRRPALDGAHCGNQRLADDLAAKHALPAGLRRAAAEQVQIEVFEIEDREQICNGGGHLDEAYKGSNIGLNLLCSDAIYKEDEWHRR